MAKYEDVNFYHLQRYRNGDFDLNDWQRFLENPQAWRRSEGGLYTLDVEYGLTFEQQVAAGKYDWKDSAVQPNRWLIEGSGNQKFQAELLHLPSPKKGYNTTDEVLAEAKRHGLIRPSAEHILAFGAQHPNVQKEFPVVGLFEEKHCWRSSDGSLGVLCLNFVSRERNLCVDWLSVEWHERCRFLFLRNIA